MTPPETTNPDMKNDLLKTMAVICAAEPFPPLPSLETTDKQRLLHYLDTIARMVHPPMNTPEGARECEDWDIRLRALIERARGNAERFL